MRTVSASTKELTAAPNRRCGARAEQACFLCRAARRKGPTALIASPDTNIPIGIPLGESVTRATM